VGRFAQIAGAAPQHPDVTAHPFVKGAREPIANGERAVGQALPGGLKRLLERVLHHRPEQLLFPGEVQIQALPRHARGARDLVHRRLSEAELQKHAERRIEQLAPPRALLAAPVGGAGTHSG
jgi:hypothetical protein